MSAEVLSYSLAEGSALANGHLVTFFNTERRGDVGGQVLVSLLVSGVLGHKVQVFSADDQGSVHLCRDNGAGQDTTADRNHAGEGTFLVCTGDEVRINVNVVAGLVTAYFRAMSSSKKNSCKSIISTDQCKTLQ